MSTNTMPSVLGPLNDPEYIEDITERFYEEMHRQPYGADELLHWHRRTINKSLREVGHEITADWQIKELGTG